MRNSIFYSCSVLLLVFIFFTSISAQDSTSQTQISLYIGASIPQGDFGSTSDDDEAGFAKTGFSGTVEGSKYFTENVSWTSSVSIAINFVDINAMEEQLPDLSVTADNYLTGWVMTGVGFHTAASPTVKFYGLGQIGLLISRFPDITLSDGRGSLTQNTSIAAAFAFGLGAGVVINRLTLGIRYYSGEPEYEQTAIIVGRTLSAKVKMQTTIFQLLIGFIL